MKRYLTIAIAAGFALAPLSLLAQFEEPDESAETPAFESLDVDGDGYVSSSEAGALPCLSDNYDSIDAASDAGLSRSEFEQAVQSYCTSW